MPASNSLKSILSLAMLGLLLSACGTDKEAKEADEPEEQTAELKQPQPRSVHPICPQVATIRELSTVHDYGNDTPEENQLVASAKLLRIKGDCEYMDESVDVSFKIEMAAQRGPRLGSSHIDFPIFIAVTDPDGTILNKDQMTTKISFSGNDKIAMHEESIHVVIPLPKDKQHSGPYYKVLSGFQLSPAQFAQNKKATSG